MSTSDPIFDYALRQAEEHTHSAGELAAEAGKAAHHLVGASGTNGRQLDPDEIRAIAAVAQAYAVAGLAHFALADSRPESALAVTPEAGGGTR